MGQNGLARPPSSRRRRCRRVNCGRSPERRGGRGGKSEREQGNGGAANKPHQVGLSLPICYRPITSYQRLAISRLAISISPANHRAHTFAVHTESVLRVCVLYLLSTPLTPGMQVMGTLRDPLGRSIHASCQTKTWDASFSPRRGKNPKKKKSLLLTACLNRLHLICGFPRRRILCPMIPPTGLVSWCCFFSLFLRPAPTLLAAIANLD